MGIMANTNLTNQRQVFVEEYVRSGDHLEAAKKAGYKDTHTLRNQACKLRRECADQITDELHRNFAEIAPRVLNILTDQLNTFKSFQHFTAAKLYAAEVNIYISFNSSTSG